MDAERLRPRTLSIEATMLTTATHLRLTSKLNYLKENWCKKLLNMPNFPTVLQPSNSNLELVSPTTKILLWSRKELLTWFIVTECFYCTSENILVFLEMRSRVIEYSYFNLSKARLLFSGHTWQFSAFNWTETCWYWDELKDKAPEGTHIFIRLNRGSWNKHQLLSVFKQFPLLSFGVL